MEKLYSYSDSGRGWRIEGMFVSDEESLKELYDKDLYYGEVCGKHSELTLNFSEGDFNVVTEDQDFIRKFIVLVGYSGYNPFCYLPEDEEELEEEDEE